MQPIKLNPHSKILVVKLADLGDVLTATPALRALRESYPQATIDLLLTHHTAPAMAHSRLVDNLIPSDNFRIFSPAEAFRLHRLKAGPALFRRIWRRYEAVVILHHLTLRSGALKYAAIAGASGANVVAGLAPPGKRGRFLTRAVPDEGFGARREVDYWLAVAGLLGAKTDDPSLELAVSSPDEAWAAQKLADINPTGPVVVVHPGSGGFSSARRWPASNFAAVADALARQGARIALVGRPGDGADAVSAAMNAPATDLTGQTTLHQLAALLQKADLFIGGDSGVTHVAAACGTPLVAIFGPTNASAWGPAGKNRRVLQATLPCGPCAYVGHRVGLRHGCQARTCLKLVAPQQVLRAARHLLNAPPPARPSESPPPDNVALPAASIPTAEILGVRVQAVTFEQTLQRIEAFIATRRPHQIATVNPEFVVAAQGDAVFRRIINRAALAFPDGTGLLKAARWLRQPPLPERIAGVDIVDALARLSAEKGYRLYFLGARPGIAEKAVAALKNRYPKMVVAGAFAGSPRAADEDEIVSRIQAARPDVVLVAYGAPHQDKWIARNMNRLPAGVLIGVGGAFDFISGAVRRAPVWMRRAGLEWVYRFAQQPSRWRRMWNAVPRFVWLAQKERLRQKFSQRH